MNPAIHAAVEVARQFRIDCDEPELIQETNHTVVWLRPHAVIAKVGTRRDAEENLIREFGVADELFSRGAPVVRPMPASVPTLHSETQCFVTLWQRLEHDPDEQVRDVEVGESLKRLHVDLERCTIPLPNFRVAVNKARQAALDDVLMSGLPNADRALLRRAYDQVLSQLASREFAERPLHGEPHAGNYISTRSGIRWLDFENVCFGPLEWDLAFLSSEARKSFSDFDDDLLLLLVSVISACVATWCGIQARFPEMRAHGEEHLGQLRAAMGDG